MHLEQWQRELFGPSGSSPDGGAKVLLMKCSFVHFTCLGRNADAAVWGLELCFLQNAQWQTKLSVEGPVATKPTAPHWQFPTRVGFGRTKSEERREAT